MVQLRLHKHAAAVGKAEADRWEVLLHQGGEVVCVLRLLLLLSCWLLVELPAVDCMVQQVQVQQAASGALAGLHSAPWCARRVSSVGCVGVPSYFTNACATLGSGLDCTSDRKRLICARICAKQQNPKVVFKLGDSWGTGTPTQPPCRPYRTTLLNCMHLSRCSDHRNECKRTGRCGTTGTRCLMDAAAHCAEQLEGKSQFCSVAAAKALRAAEEGLQRAVTELEQQNSQLVQDASFFVQEVRIDECAFVYCVLLAWTAAACLSRQFPRC